jgi:hypothetical protein
VNAGQAYDASQRLGLKSPNAIEQMVGGLDEAGARQAIEKYNQFARDTGRSDATLNMASADLVTVALLPLLTARSLTDRSEGRVKSGRLSLLVDVWRELEATPDAQPARA